MHLFIILMECSDECKSLGIRPPNYQECSDRRGEFQHIATAYAKLTSSGGRTAWSSIVEVNGSKHQARYWYDGSWVNNAREDAAEVALQRMGVVPAPRGPHSRLLGAIAV